MKRVEIIKRKVFAGLLIMSFTLLLACGKKDNIEDVAQNTVTEAVEEAAPTEAVITAEPTAEPAEAEETTKETEETVSMEDEILAAYQPVFDSLSTDELYDGRYEFIYLNDDDIPELAVSWGIARLDGVEIYAIFGDETKKLYCEVDSYKTDVFGSEGNISYAEGSGLIEFGSYSQGSYDGRIAKWDGKTEKMDVSSHRFIKYDEEMVPLSFNIDSKQVGVSEYYAYARTALQGNKCNISYYGCKGADETDTEKELAKATQLRTQCYLERLKKATGSKADIAQDSYLIYDFDCDGARELFAIYEGDLWFVTDSSCEKLQKTDDSDYQYVGSPMMIDCGSDGAFVYAYTDRYVTDLITDMWVVEKGKAVSGSMTGMGMIDQVANPYVVGDFAVVISGYDATMMIDDGFMVGHTWKPYFFNYTSKNGVKGYESVIRTPSEIEAACGFDLCRVIINAGNDIDAMAEFDNGIIVVNYHRSDYTDEINYYYVMWDIYGGMHKEGGFYGTDSSDIIDWQKNEQSGIYSLN